MRRRITALLCLAFLASACGDEDTSTAAGEAPEGMTFIPGRSFQMGTDSSAIPGLMARFETQRAEFFLPEIPSHDVVVRPFYLDKTEVTNAQFAAFVREMPGWAPDSIPAAFDNRRYLDHWDEGTYPSEQGDHPVVFVFSRRGD